MYTSFRYPGAVGVSVESLAFGGFQSKAGADDGEKSSEGDKDDSSKPAGTAAGGGASGEGRKAGGRPGGGGGRGGGGGGRGGGSAGGGGGGAAGGGGGDRGGGRGGGGGRGDGSGGGMGGGYMGEPASGDGGGSGGGRYPDGPPSAGRENYDNSNSGDYYNGSGDYEHKYPDKSGEEDNYRPVGYSFFTTAQITYMLFIIY